MCRKISKLMPDLTISSLINSYLFDLKKSNKVTGQTILNYKNYLNKFVTWYKNNYKQEILKLDEKILDGYKQYLIHYQDKQGQELSTLTQNYYLIALRSLLKYLQSKNIFDFDYKNIKLSLAKKKNKPTINVDLITRLLKSPEATNEPDIIKKRDAAILSLLINFGLKVSAVTKLKRQDFIKSIDAALPGTSNKILATDATYKLITDYLSLRHDTDQSLFISHDRAGRSDKRLLKKIFALSPRTVQRIIKRYSQACGLTKTLTPSDLRFWYGHKIISDGASLKQAQSALGHAHTATTKLYK